MTTQRSAIENLLPWSGLIGTVAGWFASHEVGFYTIFDDCTQGGLFVVIVSLVGLVIALGGGFLSWQVWSRGLAETEGRRFAGLINALVAWLASFAILLQIAAGLILPRCLA